MSQLANIYRLGVKELWSLLRDPLMLVFVVYTFTLQIFAVGTAMQETLHNAPIAVVDEDGSQLSARLVSAFYPPYFKQPALIPLSEVDPGMDAGRYTFVLNIPPGFQRDVLARRSPTMQLNVDATQMNQAFIGNGHIEQIINAEINEFAQRHRGIAAPNVELVSRARFNPTLTQRWFNSIAEVVNAVTLVSILLAGASLMREREHGTVEHLLVMPVSPLEIMLAKVLSMGLVVLLMVSASLTMVIRGMLDIPIEGSLALFLACAALHSLATTSMGIFMATVTRSMPQFTLLLILIVLPLQLLSGGVTPRESMPGWVQNIMLLAPTTHFTSAAQAILFRGAGIDIVWPQLLAIIAIGAVLFALSLARFRKTIGQTT